MRSQDYEMSGSDFAPLEQLLFEAAAWEPDVPAPVGLAGRAMAAELERQDRERMLRGRERRAGLFATFFMSASAVSATVAFAFFHWSPQASGPAHTGPAAPATAPAAVATVRPGQGAPSEVIIAATDRRAAPARAFRRRRLAGTAIPRRRVEKKAAEAPTALWREETVRHEVAGVLSTGWLIRQNPEDGSYSITPGVLDVQAGAQDACGESPAPNNETLAVPPPPLPQPSAPLGPAAENVNAPDGITPSLEKSGVPPVPES